MSGTLAPVKRHAAYQEQIQNLIDHNLTIDDAAKVEAELKKVHYYRLSGYMRFFKDAATGMFADGTTFEKVCRLYEFDRRLRKLVMGQLEMVEVMLRSRISYQIASVHGELGHLKQENFWNAQYHQDFVADLGHEIRRSSNVTFVAHHQNRYDGQLPIWVAVEVMSFGTLSKLYSNMRKPDKKAIAKELGLTPPYLESWLRHFCFVRNVCAHYSRVYARTLQHPPIIYSKDREVYFSNPIAQQRTFWGTVYAMKKLFAADGQWRHFVIELTALLEEYEDVVALSELGFDEDWASKMS